MPVGPYPDFATCVAAQKRRDPSLSDESARAICGKMEQDTTSSAATKHGRAQPGEPLTINGEHLPTEDLVGVEVFDTGTWNGEPYSDEQITDLIDNTNELIGEGLVVPPVKIGHSDDQDFLKREGYPAAGWITTLYRQGTKVMADIVKVPQKVAILLKAHAYRKVSSEIWRDYGKAANGKKYGHVFKALAFLGEEIPAVSTLDDAVGLYGRRMGSRAVTFGTDRKADGVVTMTLPDPSSDEDTDAIAETLADQFERMASTIKDTTKGKIGAPRMRAFLTETSRALRALMGGDAKKHEQHREADRFDLTHNNETKGGEPPWSEVDKAELPRQAFADQGEADMKSSWKYPHHWVSGGTMYLHLGGLRAALSAAGGGRSGQEAPSDVNSHLNAHAAAVGVGEHTKRGADMEPKVIAKALGLKEDASEQDILAAATAQAEKVTKFADMEREVTTFREEKASAAATTAVETAIKDRRLAPAQKEWALKFARKDPEEFASFVKATPAIFTSPKGSDKGAPEGETDARSSLNRLALEKQDLSKGEMSYTEALNKVKAENPDLARQAAQAN